MTSLSTNPTSIGLTPSDFLALAKRVSRFRSAWQKFSGILIRVGQTSVPTTAPTPTDNPDDPLNTTITIFKGLFAAIDTGCLDPSACGGSQYATEGAAHIIGFMPYVTSWIMYIITEVIVPGREPEFREDFAEVVSNLVYALVGARTHPSVFEYIIALEAPDGTRMEGQTFFLSGVIPPLVFHSTSSSPHSRTTVLRHCFKALGYLIGQYTHYDDLPLYGRELYNNLCADPKVFADLFLSCVIDAVIIVKAHAVSDTDFKDCTRFLGLSYRGLHPFLSEERVANRFMEIGYLRWTCEMMATVSQLKFLRRAEMIDLSMKEAHLVVSDGCVHVGYLHIGRLIYLFGVEIAREAYTGQAGVSLARMNEMVMRHVDDRSIRDLSVKAVANFVWRTAPYLIYHSVLKAAIRAREHMMRFVTQEVRATEKWKVYEEQLEKMIGLYELHKANPVTICDSYECSNLDSSNVICRSSRCSGCGVKYYCSLACQKTDWDHRHRESCRTYQQVRQSRSGVSQASQAIDSRDVHFLNYVAHDVMYAYRNEDHTLVRNIDFTVCPPKVSLSSVVEEDYAVYGIDVDDISKSTPMAFSLPMGRSPVKRSGSWNCHAFGVEALEGRSNLAYDPEMFSV